MVWSREDAQSSRDTSEESTAPVEPVIKESREGSGDRYFDRRVVARATSRSRTVSKITPTRAREVSARNPLTLSERKEKVKVQRERCIYCSHKFGSSVFDRHGNEIVVRVRYDHFEPFRLRENNAKENIFAACQICNSMKSDFLFDTLHDVRKYVEQKWREAGYTEERPYIPFDTQNWILSSIPRTFRFS